jgi:hypothetical protein
MRDLWNAANKLPKKEEKGKINDPVKLQSISVLLAAILAIARKC